MKNTAIAKKVSGAFYKASFKLKQYSPEILVVTGVLGAVASTVMACKATTKIDTILANAKEDIDVIHKYAEVKEIEVVSADGEITTEVYTPEDSKKDLAIVYAQTGVKLAKLYAPAVAVGVLSITSILAGSNILRKRNVALVAAYNALDNSFKRYSNGVIERFGEEVHRELKYNIKAQKIEETVVDEETGKKKKVKSNINVIDPDKNLNSPYARFYDDGNTCWEKDPESNLYFLRAEQNYANDRLKARGYLFLNEVYERLGIPTTEAGQFVGWIYDPENPDHEGDNYVDFGIYDLHREGCRDFVNGRESVILLDFNVDGAIHKKIEKVQR